VLGIRIYNRGFAALRLFSEAFFPMLAGKFIAFITKTYNL